MATHDGADREVLEHLDAAMIRAIKGAIWFPLVYFPRQIQASSLLAMRLLRIGVLIVLWGALVFGPATLLGGIHSPVIAMAIMAWTLLAIVGSIGGALGSWKSARPAPATNKPEDLREAFA